MNKTKPEYSDSLQRLLAGSFGIALNANDFFEYACADMVIVDPKDLVWVLLIYEKYGPTGLDACQAFIAKRMPLTPYLTPLFKEVYAEIETLNPKVYSEY